MLHYRLVSPILVLCAASGALAGDEHREQLARDLRTAMQPPPAAASGAAAPGEEAGPLADRFADAAKAWAFQDQTRSSDFRRLRSAVKSVRGLLDAPAASASSGDFEALVAQLEPILGAEALALVGDLQQAMFDELVALFAAARAAEPPSTPENGLPFTYQGERYGWAVLDGQPMIVRWGSQPHRRSGVTPTPAGAPACPDGHGGGPSPAPASAPASRGGGGGPAPGSVPASAPSPVSPSPVPSSVLPGDVDQRNLDGLEPAFREKVIRILRRLQAEGWQPRVASGRRTLAEQKVLLQKGYSKTLKSWHLKGLAADIIDSRWGWSGPAANLDHPFWNALGAAGRAEGLVWGGDWKSFRDVAHVQDSN